MDSPRPLLSAELGFFNKGTGRGEFRDPSCVAVMLGLATKLSLVSVNNLHMHMCVHG
jgi:hypothetical protein